MKRYINKLVIAALAVGAASCTGSYEDINSNPYEPGDLTGDDYALGSQLNNIAGCVMSADVNTIQFTDALLGGTLGGYFSDANAGFTESIARYNPKNDWTRVFLKSDQIIPTLYANFGQVETISQSTGNPVPLAVATVIKVAAMSRVTDTYGPIPYSAIGTGDLVIPYDSQEAVYDQFFQELSDAIAVLHANRGVPFSPLGDYVYRGDIQKWIKFANSLKLRLATRISFVKPQLAKQMAEEAIAGGVMESNDDNATWKYFESLTNSLYTAVNYNNNGSVTGGDTHAAADIICYMDGYNDPRREAYFLKSVWEGLDYCGLRRGWTTFDKTWGFNFSGVNIKANDPLIWMTASEVAFLRAEGVAIHGWNMGGGSAESYYNEGIRLSFEQWGASGAEAYMADNTSMPSAYTDPSEQNPWNGSLSSITIKWEEGASRETKLERIITQKWIALYYNGNEAWAELRRTGYPKLIPVAYNGSGGVVDSNLGPQRMPYPQEEYTNNSYNVTQAVNTLLNGPDNMGTKVWWARGNR